jgi:arylsulfatase A-like enzyme
MVSRRDFLAWAGLSAAAGFWGGCGTSTRAEKRAAAGRPNFIIFYADDLGYGDLGCYGHPTLHTPTLDRLAAEGMKLTQFYSASSVCSPSRAALLTGRYPKRTGITAVLFPHHTKGLPPEEITIAKALKTAGYRTACIGKWHLGHTPGHLPTDHGFDSYYGIPYSNDMSVDPTMKVAPDAVFREGMSAAKMRSETPKKNRVPLMRDDAVVEYPADQRTLTRRYTEHAVQFIRDRKDTPFFLYFAHTFPHVPLHASEDFLDTSRRGLYGDVIEEMDASAGTILRTLNELGLADNTLVIFTSDNGPWLAKKEAGGSQGLLRGGKFTTWEGGVREPCIAWWPSRIPAASVSMEMASTLDVFPTLLDFAGVAADDMPVLDGFSIRPVLTGNGKSPRNEMFYYRDGRLRAVRRGPWKLHMETMPEQGGPYQKQAPPLLFHLEHDPGEQVNVAAEHPEIVNALTALADAQAASL